MERKKVLVLATLLIGFAALGSLGFYRVTRLPKAVSLDAKGFPAFGNVGAPLHIVSFEDLRCCNCKRFHEEIFPQIQAHYIDTGKAHYTFVPLAFMGGSKPLANAALAVYESSPKRFFPFIRALFDRFQQEDPDFESLMEVAKSIGGIDLAYFENAIQQKVFYQKLETTLAWAKELMRESFGVPTLYINGIHAPTGSFRAIEARIQKVQP